MCLSTAYIWLRTINQHCSKCPVVIKCSAEILELNSSFLCYLQRILQCVQLFPLLLNQLILVLRDGE